MCRCEFDLSMTHIPDIQISQIPFIPAHNQVKISLGREVKALVTMEFITFVPFCELLRHFLTAFLITHFGHNPCEQVL